MKGLTLTQKILLRGAKLISFVFTPFYVPLLSFVIILLFTHLSLTISKYEVFYILDIIFRFTIVLPLISIFFLHSINHLSLIDQVSTPQKCLGSLMVSTLCYLFIYTVLLELGQTMLYANIVSCIGVLLLFTLIPYKWRKDAKVTGLVDEFDLLPLGTLNQRKARFMPLILTLISYIFCAMMMFKKVLPWYLNSIIIASILVTAILLCINRWLRISEHMASIGAVTGGIISLTKLFEYNPLFGICLLIAIAGVLGTARMYLKHNNIGEIFLGYLIGLSCSLIAFNNTCYHYISTIFTYK